MKPSIVEDNQNKGCESRVVMLRLQWTNIDQG